MKYLLIIVILLLGNNLILSAQQNNDFDSFRKDAMSRFNQYRKDVLSDYTKYLENIWQEYNTFKGRVRYTTPKPMTVPTVDENNPSTLPKMEPVTKDPIEEQPNIPINKDLFPTSYKDTILFKFYETSYVAPNVKIYHLEGEENEKRIAEAWNYYQKNNIQKVIPYLRAIAEKEGFNDWISFQLLRTYANRVAYNGSNADRVILQHFLLIHWGFDIRLARTKLQFALLVPFSQKVYSQPYISVNGIDYYVYFNESEGITEHTPQIYTCTLPKEVEYGKKINLRISQNIGAYSDKFVKCTLTDGVITINGEVSMRLMDMLKHYPQMDIAEYAMSNIHSELRNSVINQLKQQIEGRSAVEAVELLLHFVQYAFDYATDGEQHGYEKPYFFEENFYYPKNDCEDRAIFFAYLIRNTLGIDVHLIEYPGHECTAICFPFGFKTGTNYRYQDKWYTICDPTYIGAKIGMCMPSFENESPKLEIW